MISIAIVGQGNVGSHLSRIFQQKNVHLIEVNSRDLSGLNEVDITILAVSDDAIAEVSSHISNSLVVHTSGTMPLEELKNETRKGVFYPLQSFSKNKAVDFSEIPFCLEAEHEEDLQILEQLVEMIGAKPYKISSEQRKYLHVAAVFANNFSNHMYAKAKEICDENQVPFEILLPLIQETAKKITEISPVSAQTGPAVRNDQKTIKNHVNLLNQSEKEIYQLLTDSIQKHGKKL